MPALLIMIFPLLWHCFPPRTTLTTTRGRKGSRGIESNGMNHDEKEEEPLSKYQQGVVVASTITTSTIL